MVGKTIASVQEQHYGETLVRFTDGSAVLLRGAGYETDEVMVTELDGEALAENDIEQEAHRRREQEERRRAAERAKERTHMRETLTPEEFEAWEREQLGPFGYIMKQEFAGAIKDQLKDTQRMMLFFRGDHA